MRFAFPYHEHGFWGGGAPRAQMAKQKLRNGRAHDISEIISHLYATYRVLLTDKGNTCLRMRIRRKSETDRQWKNENAVRKRPSRKRCTPSSLSPDQVKIAFHTIIFWHLCYCFKYCIGIFCYEYPLCTGTLKKQSL